MKFLWPEMLWLLLILPVTVGAYLVMLRRRKKTALRYASLTVVKEAMGAVSKFKRHVPPALLLAALVLLLLAAARPMAVVTLPSQHSTVILAMDTSGSMRATDVAPNRLGAAQAAAKAFVKQLPQSTRVGIVSFAATAALVQPPTNDRESLIAAIDRFQMMRGTAIGNGIIISLATIFPGADISVSSLISGRPLSSSSPLGREASEPEKKEFEPVAPGSYNSAVIILLTDGQNNTGADPLESAKLAADRGVRIYTVGIGTATGETIGYEGWSMRVRLDEETLKKISVMTDGQYFYAGNAADLVKVYGRLSSRVLFEQKETEITALLSAAAAVIMLLGAALSLLWFNRVM